MSDFEKLFSQIKQLSAAITEKNYYDYSKKGYDILIRIYDMGITQEQVYSAFCNIITVYKMDYLKSGLQKC